MGNFDNWDKRPNGDLAMKAMVSFDSAAVRKASVGLLRLEYASDYELKERAFLQLALGPVQLVALRDALDGMIRTLAEHLAAEERPDKPN